MVKVLIVDDHELVRAGLRRILEEAEDIEVLAEAESGEKAVRLAAELEPDLLLMDISMPGIGGIEATRTIRRRDPNVQVVVVTVHSDAPFPDQLLDAGALGYLTKGCPAGELLLAVRTVAEGRPFVSSIVSEKLTLSRISGTDPESPFNSLSKREMQVLMLIIQGMKNADISDSLFLSPKTVSTYRHRLYEKLQVETDVGLAFVAMRHGLVQVA